MEAALRTGGTAVIAVHERGAPAERILAEAEKLGPDIIVVGSHGHRAAYHLILGSVVQKLTRHAAWPLLIVPSLRTVNSPKAG